MKAIQSLLLTGVLATLAVSANAAQVGYYAGAGVGAAHVGAIDVKPDGAGFTRSVKNNVAAGRLFAGYNFRDNLGVELGVTKAMAAKYKLSNASASSKNDTKVTVFDVVAKGYYPVFNNVELFGLGGVALMHVNTDQNDVAFGETNHVGKTHNALRPELGVGASYAVTKKVSAQVEYRYVFGRGNVNKSASAMPNLQTGMLTIAYNFS